MGDARPAPCRHECRDARRESGSLEQDADIVMLLRRTDATERDDPRAGEADIILGKHRGGPTATITVAHQLHFSRFVEMSRGM